MKLTAFLLLVAVIQVSARGTAQTVTYSANNASVTTVLGAIREQTGYTFVFRNQDVQHLAPVSVRFERTALADALTTLLKDARLNFRIEDNAVFISKTAIALSISGQLSTMLPPITGIVLGPGGQPLAGINVVVKGTRKGTTTNDIGRFAVEAAQGQVLIISGIGYQSREVVITDESISISLVAGDNKLDEVQIIAYGQTTRRLNTGNVTTVKAETIEKQPVTNPLAALSDKVPGLLIVQQTGLSGGTFKVQIRGQNSLLNGNDPLYVIDGVPYTSTLLPSQGDQIFGTNNGTIGNPLNFINLNNIESIDVLKDADATAIYGSRGANGVILITTKKGTAGKMGVELNVNSGIAKATKKLHYMNTPQYLAMRKEAFANDGMVPTRDNAPDIAVWDSTRYTDWQDLLIGGTANFTTAQLGVSGGNDLTAYHLSGIYSRQTTVFIGDYANAKAGLNFNLSGHSQSRRFSFNFSGSFTHDDNQVPLDDLTGSIDLPPNTPKLYQADGSLNYEDGTFFNPLRSLNERFRSKTNNLVANLTTGYQLAKGLELKTSLGYNLLQLDQVSSTPLSAIPPFLQAYIRRSSAFTDNRIGSWIIEPQLTYSSQLGRGRLDALLGATLQTVNSNGTLIAAEGYTSDALLNDLKSAPTIRVQNSSSSLYKYNALFGRITYNLMDRYLVNLTGRRDGSSRFGPDNRFQNFGAIGLGWIFTQEDWLKNINILSFGKIRASLGWTGNDQIGDYRFQNLYQSWYSSYQGVTGLVLNNLYNPNLQWEVNRKQEVGLELGFVNNRINVSASFYRNIASNQLVAYPLSSVTGFTDIPYNLNARVQNKGWEFLVSSMNVKTPHFSWTSSFNLSVERNKLLEYEGLDNSPYARRYIIGQPITIGRTLRFAGLDPETGVYQFYDRDGKVTFNPTYLDATNIVNFVPKFYGGLNNQLSYRQFSLDFSLQFVKQPGSFFPFISIPGTDHNQTVDIVQHWQKPGDQTPYPQYTASYGTPSYSGADFAKSSDWILTDASFIRLKNVALSWSLPTGLCERIHVQRSRVYINAQNVARWTRYPGLDPETQSSQGLPLLLTIVGGFQITL